MLRYGGGVKGVPQAVIPQEKFYMISTEAIGTTKGGLYICARKLPPGKRPCSQIIDENVLGLAKYCWN